MDFRDIKFVYFKDTAPWRWGWVRFYLKVGNFHYTMNGCVRDFYS